ncbi:MAG: ketoacyl-ACP synthase III [Actinobacteria bacterium]|nr:ketoacyl-ACP synthase III [Actinomycetota bacterium]
MNSFRAVITGTGVSLPKRILTNRELESMVDTDDEWIKTRTGIEERRLVEPDENVSDMAAEAGVLALKEAGIEVSDLHLIVLATSSPDMIMPSAACMTQAKLGATCPAFDVMAACSGFVFGLSVGAQYIESGSFKNVLVIGSDALTRHLDWEDRRTCVLFGDGAGAVVLTRSNGEHGVLASYLASDGRGADLLKIPAGGSASPGSEKTLARRDHCIKMNGHEVFKFAVRAIPDAVEKALTGAGLEPKDIDYLIPHQANRRIIDAAAERLDIDLTKVVVNIERYGNTSTASIPIALDELNREGRLREGDVLVFVGFGAGLTWGANVVRWGKGVAG